jgi:hypothetical protein
LKPGPPPEHLSEKARKLWARIVFSKPAGWFGQGSLPLLAQYCDLVAEQADLVVRRNELYSMKPVDSLERLALIRAKCDVNKAIREYALASTTLAVKSRLSVQNTIDRKGDPRRTRPGPIEQRDDLTRYAAPALRPGRRDRCSRGSRGGR